MSHHKEREEKACLNCGTAPLYDRYCHHCGQENVPPKQSVWHLITHFFNDVTHFDGKFFATMKMLILKPGFLSSEYIKGKRSTYLDPIRMYLFISSVFFIFMFSFSGDDYTMKNVSLSDHKTIQIIDSLRKSNDVNDFQIYSEDFDGQNYPVMFVPYKCRHGVKGFDSINKIQPSRSPARQYLGRRLAAIFERYEMDPYNFFPEFVRRLYHSLSKIFFISLPLFAFFLYLLYIRRKNNHYYVTHAIFSLHYYSVAFIFIFLAMLSNRLPNSVSYIIVSSLQMFIFIGLFLYLLVAMKRFYKQGWIKTLLKFSVLSVCTVVMLATILLGLLLNSFMSMAAAH